MADRLVLIGMMGAGKTTVGQLAAGRLGWAYFDSDRQVESDTGRSVAELFAERGEEAFRAEESRVLAEALASPAPVVVSAAGGVVLAPSNRRLLRGAGPVVWLRARPDTLAARVGSGRGRPLLDGADPAATVRELDDVRRPLYEEVCTAVVDVDELEPADIVERVLEVAGLAGLAHR